MLTNFLKSKFSQVVFGGVVLISLLGAVSAGGYIKLYDLISGEDQTNNVIKTEQRFSVCVDDADIVCNAAPGFLHSVWCYERDGAPTAGTVRITNTTAAGGAETTEVWGKDITTTVGSGTGSAVLDIEMTTGITIDFTTTADVKCGVSYRDNG